MSRDPILDYPAPDYDEIWECVETGERVETVEPKYQHMWNVAYGDHFMREVNLARGWRRIGKVGAA